MSDLQWVLPETVLALQEGLLAEFGGLVGVRDPGLFESAMTRPRQRLHYEPADAFDLAAAYAFGLVRNHPFFDGNKRIAFASAVLFLELNGWTFTATEVDAVVQTLALAAGELEERGYADWLRANAEPR